MKTDPYQRQRCNPLNVLFNIMFLSFFIFDENLTFFDQISSLFKSCYSRIRDLRCIRPYLDSKTASTIAASIVHSKHDYCTTIFLSHK